MRMICFTALYINLICHYQYISVIWSIKAAHIQDKKKGLSAAMYVYFVNISYSVVTINR